MQRIDNLYLFSAFKINIVSKGPAKCEGTEVTLTATPADDGWKFDHWEGDVPSGHEADNPLIITMDSDKTVTAVFTEIPQYTLTVDTEGQGDVSLNPTGGTYDEGTQVTLTAIEAPGWKFDHWEGDLSGDDNPATITMNSDKTVTAVFTNTAPTAAFTATTNDLTVNVDASGCSDNENSTDDLEVRWDWTNDGTYDTDWSTTKTASHTYSSAGTYTIKLQVKDVGGLTSETTKQVTMSITDYFLEEFAAGKDAAKYYSPNGGWNDRSYGFKINYWNVPKQVEPGQVVPCSLAYTIGSGNNPNAVVYKTVLAEWSPNSPIAVLENGELEGQPRTVRKDFTFTAPTTPGTYRIRLAMTWAFQGIENFYGEGPAVDAWNPGVGQWAEVILKVQPMP